MIRKAKASITIFSALSLMLVAAVTFSLLEAARVQEVRKVARMNSNAAVESVFAEYNTPLYKKYNLLGYWAGSAKGRMSMAGTEVKLEDYSNESYGIKPLFILKNPIDLIHMKTKANVNGYSLITDDNGMAFVNAVSAYEKQNLPENAANEIFKKYSEINQSSDKNKMEKDISDGSDAIDDPKQYAKDHDIPLTKEEAENGNASESKEQSDNQDSQEENQEENQKKENPLKALKDIKDRGILSVVVEKPGEISKNEIDTSDMVSNRKLEKGTKPLSTSKQWYNKVALEHYITSKFSNFKDPRVDGALQYEQEFILCGKNSDVENLKSTINKILLTRQAANMAAIVKDPQKMAEAEALATTLAGITLNPAIIECVKWGLITGWAYGESILDVRTLLSGGKISPIKSSSQWTLSLSGLGSLANGSIKAKDCKNGMDYNEYVAAMLVLKNQGNIAMNAMSLMEKNVKSEKGYENFKMDNVVIEMNVDYTYSHNPVFLSLIPMKLGNINCFEYTDSASYSYLKNCKK